MIAAQGRRDHSSRPGDRGGHAYLLGQDLLDALRAGARGYLPKEIGRDGPRETLDKVLAGEVVMPMGLVATVPDARSAVRLLVAAEDA
jgi:DNA-binding NarL/FixJ family response regulator